MAENENTAAATTVPPKSDTELRQIAQKVAGTLFSNGTGDIMSVFNPLLGGAGEKLGDKQLHFICGLVRSGKITFGEVYNAIKRVHKTEQMLEVGRAYYEANDVVSKPDYFEFIKLIRDVVPILVGDLIRINKNLTKTDLQRILRENTSNEYVWIEIGEIEKEDLDNRR